jgi:hypothetical protein
MTIKFKDLQEQKTNRDMDVIFSIDENYRFNFEVVLFYYPKEEIKKYIEKLAEENPFKKYIATKPYFSAYDEEYYTIINLNKTLKNKNIEEFLEEAKNSNNKELAIEVFKKFFNHILREGELWKLLKSSYISTRNTKDE